MTVWESEEVEQKTCKWKRNNRKKKNRTKTFKNTPTEFLEMVKKRHFASGRFLGF